MSTATRVALVVTTLVALAGLVLAARLWQDNRQLEQSVALETAESEATRAAAEIAVAMTTYDHRTLGEDFAWVEEDGTRSFRETYAESTEPIRGLIERTRAIASGTVTDSAGTAQDADTVEVLLFVDQELQRADEQRSSVDSSRVVMTMVRQDGRWLVDEVDLR